MRAKSNLIAGISGLVVIAFFLGLSVQGLKTNNVIILLVILLTFFSGLSIAIFFEENKYFL